MSNDSLMQEIKPKVSFYGIKSIYYLIVVLIIVQLAALSIGKGGRWVLNEQIASAINYKYFGSFYTDSNAGYLALKTPYTPGLSFLISILPLQNTRLVNIVLLTIACLTCLFFLSCLIKISTKYLFAVEDKQFFRLIIAGIFGSCLGVYLSYSAEFKTTNIGLIISLASTLLIFLGRIKGNCLYSLAAIFLGILAILFKQQFVFIFLINLLIVQYNLIHERRFFACTLILIVLGIFSFYFFDSEIFYYSFVKPAGHLFRFNNISFIVTEFISNPVFYFLVIISIVLISIKLYNALLRKNIYQSLGKLEVILMLQAISWFVAEIISMFKQGGNVENVQASVVLFIPFVALYVYKGLFKYKVLLSFFLLFSVCLSTIRTIKFSGDNFSRNKAIEYSIQNLKIDRSAKILISDELYLYLKNASFGNMNSLNGLFYFFANPRYNRFDFPNYLETRINSGSNKISYIITNYSLEDFLAIFKSAGSLKLIQMLQDHYKLTETVSWRKQPCLYIYQKEN